MTRQFSKPAAFFWLLRWFSSRTSVQVWITNPRRFTKTTKREDRDDRRRGVTLRALRASRPSPSSCLRDPNPRAAADTTGAGFACADAPFAVTSASPGMGGVSPCGETRLYPDVASPLNGRPAPTVGAAGCGAVVIRPATVVPVATVGIPGTREKQIVPSVGAIPCGCPAPTELGMIISFQIRRGNPLWLPLPCGCPCRGRHKALPLPTGGLA
jgi:hypothetical protein